MTNTFDSLNRLLTRGYPDGGVERFGYTPNIPALTSYTNQLGSNTLNLIYDHLGRKTAEIVPTATTNSFAYSPAGDLVALTDGKGQTTTWHFDQFGRATNKVDATDTEIFRYAYDPNGRLTNRWSAAKGNTAYSFDPLGNLTNINYPVSPDISLAYDVFSSTQGDLAGGRLSYWDSYCLARCTCEPGGKAGRLGQNRKEQVPETMG